MRIISGKYKNKKLFFSKNLETRPLKDSVRENIFNISHGQPIITKLEVFVRRTNFKNNSQPYYVLLSPNLEVLNKPIQYTDTDTYQSWLSEGLENFKKNYK